MNTMGQSIAGNGVSSERSSVSGKDSDASSSVKTDQAGQPIDQRLGAPIEEMSEIPHEGTKEKVSRRLRESKKVAAKHPAITIGAVAGAGALAAALLFRSSKDKAATQSVRDSVQDFGSRAFASLRDIDAAKYAEDLSSDASRVFGNLEDSARRALDYVEQNGKESFRLAKKSAEERPVLASCAATGLLAALTYGLYKAGKGLQQNSSPRFENWTKEELYERAKELDIEGRSQMSKDELVECLREYS